MNDLVSVRCLATESTRRKYIPKFSLFHLRRTWLKEKKCDCSTVALACAWPTNVMISTSVHIEQHAGNGLDWFKYKINSITYTSNDTADKRKSILSLRLPDTRRWMAYKHRTERNYRNRTRTDDYSLCALCVCVCAVRRSTSSQCIVLFV